MTLSPPPAADPSRDRPPVGTRPVRSSARPLDALAAWPAETPLACLWSGDTGHPRARWTVLAAIDRVHHPRTADELRALLDRRGTAPTPTDDLPPFRSGLIGWLGYDLGRVLETRAAHPGGSRDDRRWPLAALAECSACYAFDHAAARWFASGPRDRLPPLPTGPAQRRSVRASFEIEPFDPASNRVAFTDAVRRVIGLIHAGDAYQVNLAHRLSTVFSGDARALFALLTRAAEPWFGGYLESCDDAPHARRRALLSASPELFLSYDPATRRVLTRPMKGTSPSEPGRTRARDALMSPKDRAELDMITDLLRNDLGRSAEFGSVRVEQARTVETHAVGSAGVLQGVSTIAATLRPEISFADALLAAFPPGSVTGVPKIRAMQIIDELEPVRRGPYCGSFGYLDDSGRAAFNVSIRTAMISERAQNDAPRASPAHFENADLDYPVGAGIVADSDPEAEWRETLDKAAVFLRAIAEGSAGAERVRRPGEPG